MGIFGKKKDKETAFDVMNLEEDASSPAPTEENIGGISFQPSPPSGKRSQYTIEQAIDLVKSLKKHNISSSVIAGIMKQTLESVDIHFKDIIQDAELKESQIDQANKQKDAEIQEINSKLDVLKKDKLKLQEELEQTQSAKQFLLQAMPGGTSSTSQAPSTPQNEPKRESLIEKAKPKPVSEPLYKVMETEDNK